MTTPAENPVELVSADVKTAMRAQDKDRLSTLRMLLSALKNERIEKGADLANADLVAVVRRLVKQRQDSAAQYRKGARPELAEKEEQEIAYLEAYLPAQVDEATLRQAIEAFVAAQGLSGPKGIGPVMQAMLKQFGSAAEGGTINRIAKSVLGL